jgi:8-oxo-dGTP diphosphatase
MSDQDHADLFNETLSPGMRAAGVYVAIGAVDELNRLVLVRRGQPPARGIWTLPAGRVETDETPEQAALRETREETGLTVSLRELYGEFSGPGYRLRVYVARVVSGQLAPADDAVDAEFFDLDRVPFDQLEFEQVPREQRWATEKSEAILTGVVARLRAIMNETIKERNDDAEI